MSWSTFYATLVNKNDMFAITGNIALKGKNRFPIAYGDYYMLHKRLVCDIQARLAKFTQFNLTKDEVTYFYYLTSQNLCEAATQQVFSRNHGTGDAGTLVCTRLGYTP